MLKVIFLLFLTLFTSCWKQTELTGVWSFELSLQNNTIPFMIKFTEKNKALLRNNQEIIELKYTQNKNKILIPILNFDAALELEQIENILKGHWIKYNRKEEYKLPLFGMKTKYASFPKLNESALKDNTKLKIIFADKTKGILTHDQNNSYSSIVTETGDYRYLSSIYKDNKLVLYGFDGIFAFYLSGDFNKDNHHYKGIMYAGKSYNTSFETTEDMNFQLRDPKKITHYSGDISDIKLPNLKGEIKPLISPKRATIVQIFGSWCPNCIDETRYILKWRKNNPNKSIDFVIVSFERGPNKKHTLKMLKKTKNLYKIDYPILVASYNNEKKVSDIFKGIEDFISFPTTLYVDKRAKVIKIHAGFNGPATGTFFDEFKSDFEKTIEKLLD